MSLEKWLEYGWLKREPSSSSEIKGLLGIVERSLRDAKVQVISVDLRFTAAFSAALTAATVALRASGYRASAQPGHHIKTIESLELTIKAHSNIIQRLKAFNNTRNKSLYDIAGVVSDQELAAMIRVATDLREQVMDWLQNFHPGLLK
jgi:hypothetical protein